MFGERRKQSLSFKIWLASLTEGKNKGQDQQAEAGQQLHLSAPHINCVAVFEYKVHLNVIAPSSLWTMEQFTDREGL